MQHRINCRGCLRQRVNTQVSNNLAVLSREEEKRGIVPCYVLQLS